MLRYIRGPTCCMKMPIICCTFVLYLLVTEGAVRTTPSIYLDKYFTHHCWKKPKKLIIWESFIDHDGINIAEQLDQYPIILARKIAKSKSSAGLTSTFATTIQINPPYPQVVALRKWARSNEQLLITYTKKSITSTGSPQLIPFEDQIMSIANAHQHLPAEFSLLNEDQRFYILACSTCRQIFTRLHSRRRFYCATCCRSANLIPRCQFDITITDGSGSATALIADQPSETMLHLTSEEIYDVRCTKKKDKEEATSHHRHALEVKTPPPKHYNK